MSTLVVKDLFVDYVSKKSVTHALQGFSAVFSSGINVIIGPSGSGKSTLLQTILGLLNYEGTVEFDHKNLDRTAPKDRNFAFVSQEYQLYPMYTVFDNIAFPLKIMGASKEEIKSRVYAIAERTELSVCLGRKPRQLSGGQQQRVAIARALVRNPVVCLFDEPFSNCDLKTREKARGWTINILQEQGCIGIYVTHDFKEALLLADRIFVMNDGKKILEGTPTEVYDSPLPLIREMKEASAV